MTKERDWSEQGTQKLLQGNRSHRTVAPVPMCTECQCSAGDVMLLQVRTRLSFQLVSRPRCCHRIALSPAAAASSSIITTWDSLSHPRHEKETRHTHIPQRDRHLNHRCSIVVCFCFLLLSIISCYKTYAPISH
jgi:hypothetical protein